MGFQLGRFGPSNTADFFRSNRWFVQKLGPITDRELLAYAKQTSCANYNLDSENFQGASTIYKVAKSANWEPCTIVFYDVSGLYEALEEWKELVYTPEDGVKTINEYADTTQIAIKDATGEDVQTFELVNSWPKNISHGTLSHDNSDAKLLTVTLEYSWAVLL